MAGEPLRVLLLQPWVVRGAEIRDALRAGGYEPHIYRVDYEAALHAALGRGNYEVVIYDPRVGIARALVEGSLKDHGIRVPLVDFVAGPALAVVVRAAIGALRN